MNQLRKLASDVPLIVDLDGTLIKIDSLHEAYIQLAAKKPLLALKALLTIRHGRAAFKSMVADHVDLEPSALPVEPAVLAAIEEARAAGRSVYLVSAADRRFAEAVAEAIGGFDGVIASGFGLNLKGAAKAARLVVSFGRNGFDYIGNDAVDIPVWQAARKAILAGAHPRLVARVQRERPATALITRRFSLASYLTALRPHQWLKNALIALPSLAAHDYAADGLLAVVVAFISFSLTASSVYLINDMIDLPNDRMHPEKRHRALAAGKVPVSHAAAMLVVIIAIAFLLALLLPMAFLLVMTLYFGLSVTYSVYLKRKLMVDVVTLATLYGTRVVAGASATGIVLSHWLVSFCFFMFLCLALVKRTAEMVAQPADSTGTLKGRNYRREDLPTITSLTAAAGFVSVLVLGLYVSSVDVRPLYKHPELLWGVGVILTYWLGRVCFLTGRGEMRQDPVLFAVKDRVSLLAGCAAAGLYVLASI